MGAVVTDIDPGGGGHEGVRNVLKAVTQAVLLFGAETWVITSRMERALGSFQHRVTRRLIGRHMRRQGDWRLVGGNGGVFEGICKYITRRQNTVTQYIETRSIMEFCEQSARRTGTRVSWRWWEQAGLELYGEKKRAAEAAEDPDREESIGDEEGIPPE